MGADYCAESSQMKISNKPGYMGADPCAESSQMKTSNKPEDTEFHNLCVITHTKTYLTQRFYSDVTALKVDIKLQMQIN